MSSYQFVDTDSETINSQFISAYEEITGHTLQPSDPEKLFISWVTGIIVQERVNQNYIGNQNIPSRAEGEYLDALGEWIYSISRTGEQASYCTMRFHISAAQTTAISIPQGTRVSDISKTFVWETTDDVLIEIGETYADVTAQCQTAGSESNGYEVGQINTLIDVDNILYYTSCENITATDGGAEEQSDEEYYEMLRKSLDGYSTAGSRDAYIYFAKSVSTEIADAKAWRPADGCVAIYASMTDGTIASDTIKNLIYETCSADTVRPLTDYVTVEDPECVSYSIDFTYYISEDSELSQTEIETNVTEAVNEYIEWQSAKLGRDINPDKLRNLLLNAGVKRVTINAPEFVDLTAGADGGEVPQLAELSGTVTVVNGGYEDE